MKRSRILLVAVVLLSVALAGFAVWRRGEHDAAGAYLTEAVDRGTIASIVTATGTVNPVSTIQVGTYVSGPIRAIDVDFNSPVRKGQRVAKIDPAAFQVKVQEAEANAATARAKVAKDHADLELKRLTLDRMRTLRGRELIAQNDVDTAQSNYGQAVAQLAVDEAGIQQAAAALEEARINLAYTDITSPVDGVVVSRNVDVGQTVAASFQTPTLFLIAQDLTKMEVDTNVSESDIGDIRAEQPATFTVDAYPGREFQGAVAQVRNAPITVQNVVTYDVVIAVDNPELALKPGMTATVIITTARRDDVVRIPVRALRFNPHRGAAGATPGSGASRPERRASEQPAVWVPQADGTPRRVEVQVGIRNDQFAELTGGALQAGDQTIVGMPRAARAAAAAPPPFAGGGGRRYR